LLSPLIAMLRCAMPLRAMLSRLPCFARRVAMHGDYGA